MVDWPDNTLVEQLPASAFTAAVIFSLSFLIVCNILLGRLSELRMAAVDSPLSYLLNMSMFCSRVIDFLAFFLPGESFSFRSCFLAMMHKRSQKHCTNTKENDRKNPSNAVYKSTREHICAAGQQWEKGCWGLPKHCACYPLSLCLCLSVPLTSWRTRMRPLGSLVRVGLTRVHSDFCSQLSRFCVDTHLHKSYNRERYVNRRIFLIFIIFPRRVYQNPGKPNTSIPRTPL